MLLPHLMPAVRPSAVVEKEEKRTRARAANEHMVKVDSQPVVGKGYREDVFCEWVPDYGGPVKIAESLRRHFLYSACHLWLSTTFSLAS